VPARRVVSRMGAVLDTSALPGFSINSRDHAEIGRHRTLTKPIYYDGFASSLSALAGSGAAGLCISYTTTHCVSHPAVQEVLGCALQKVGPKPQISAVAKCEPLHLYVTHYVLRSEGELRSGKL